MILFCCFYTFSSNPFELFFFILIIFANLLLHVSSCSLPCLHECRFSSRVQALLRFMTKCTSGFRTMRMESLNITRNSAVLIIDPLNELKTHPHTNTKPYMMTLGLQKRSEFLNYSLKSRAIQHAMTAATHRNFKRHKGFQSTTNHHQSYCVNTHLLHVACVCGGHRQAQDPFEATSSRLQAASLTGAA